MNARKATITIVECLNEEDCVAHPDREPEDWASDYCACRKLVLRPMAAPPEAQAAWTECYARVTTLDAVEGGLFVGYALSGRPVWASSTR